MKLTQRKLEDVMSIRHQIQKNGQQAYFDQSFAYLFHMMTGCNEETVLRLVRHDATVENPVKGRGGYAKSIQASCERILYAWESGDEFLIGKAHEFLGNRIGNTAFAWAVLLRQGR